MPKGNPSPQTVASEKYQKKAGYMVKGFKLKRELVEQYEKACEKDGVTQTAKIKELMENYIKEVEDRAKALLNK